MVPFTKEDSEGMKHSLKQVGNKYVFKIKKLGADDAGLYSVDVGGVNVFSTDFKSKFRIQTINILGSEYSVSVEP